MKNTLDRYTSTQKYETGRKSLLLIVIASFINLFSLTFAQMYFLFSSYFAQIFGSIGMEIYAKSGDFAKTLPYLIIGAVTILPYLICWIFSKKKVGWGIAALVLFVIDSILFVIDLLTFYLPSGDFSMIIDLIIRIAAIVSLISMVKDGLKKKNADQQASTEEQIAPSAGYSEEMAQIKRTVTIKRKKAFVGCAMQIPIFVDNEQKGIIKNGERITLELDGNAHELAAVIPNSGGMSKIEMSMGFDNKTYEIVFKSSFSTVIPTLVECSSIEI